ncbi:MAG: hypothetical protein H6Q73_2755 [Firmicutes bacterium]|nr:hypothetical protein [Bacillota bacterium]
MSVNQTIDASKMLGALELANPVTITSESGILTLTADSNSFIAEGSETITSIVGNDDVTHGIYVITWSTARTLTYSASALVLVGQADKTTAAGDVGVYQLNDGVVTELLYQPIAGYAAASHVHAVATDSSNGFMSSADKTKLDGIATGAEVNQDAFANVLVGDTTIAADAETATVEFEAGTNIALTADATNKKVTIAVSGQVASAAAADTAAACTGNAATATKLATARTISLTGDVTGSGTFDGSGDLAIATTGVEAAKLTTARTIALAGAVTGSGTFDGSGDLSITTSAGTVTPHGKSMFTSSGTFTVPTGVTTVYVSAISGGGGGGGGCIAGSTSVQGAGGGGGGAGQFIICTPKTVVSGETITVTIGSGGAGGASTSTVGSNGSAGSSGGNTVISASQSGWTKTLSSTNGGGGAFISCGDMWGGIGIGGGGSGWSVNDFNNLYTSIGNSIAYGGKGADSPFGVGGSGIVGASGTPSAGASGYGAGGGGGANGNNGGSGATGMVLIEW